MVEILSMFFNDLNLCLFFRQRSETSEKQGKFADAKNFPAELSTKSVDSFALALGRRALQPRGESMTLRLKV
ncbi:hypothetical protein GU927_008305 [Rhodobacteraceae bacterium HSP-20]|uniref:Uncharacterized protein n=1 Tax=Paragemmobacter amnigenus TaxID=2852097 RepID=A0ABS6J265_9RHOB|nr:hypothetical protein [Rhodobacter amnigenus]MBU9697849.1 hypothetical protein [Rhodobacter amnigenus]MBV4389076.1 hypothetical protein [Rhodobacter amnigenus]